MSRKRGYGLEPAPCTKHSLDEAVLSVLQLYPGCGSRGPGLQIKDAKDNKVNSRSLLRCKLTAYFKAGTGYAVGAVAPQQAYQFTLPCHTDTSKAMFPTRRQQASLREQQDPKGFRSNYHVTTLVQAVRCQLMNHHIITSGLNML